MRLLLLAVAVSARFCLSHQIECTTSQTKNGTFYTVPQTNATDCHYTWSDSSDSVFANFVTKNELVENASLTSLHTYSCHQEIKYSRNCISEKVEHVATCFINCTNSGEPQREPESDDERSNRAVVVWVVAILLLVLLGILTHKVKPSYSRCCNRSETAVNCQNDSANKDDVETQVEGKNTSLINIT